MLETSQLPTPRNDFVLEVETGHPGFRDHVYVSTTEGLKKLAARLEHLAEAPVGERIYFYVTRRGEPRSLGSLVFSKCNDLQLVMLQQRIPAVALKSFIAGLVRFVWFCFAVYGLVIAWADLRHWLARLLGIA